MCQRIIDSDGREWIMTEDGLVLLTGSGEWRV